nr:YetF domain-containing protein [Alkalihalophilus pseudofirmus]
MAKKGCQREGYMFFNGWEIIGRTLLVGVLAYVGLIIILRASGKRTLSKMNAFDLIVTIALGSTLATILLNNNVALAEGITAFVVLVAMQYIIAWLSVRSTVVSEMIKSQPELLYYNGKFYYSTMKKSRILEVEILQAARSSGIDSLEKVRAVLLETDGNISVLKKSDTGTEQSTLRNIQK